MRLPHIALLLASSCVLVSCAAPVEQETAEEGNRLEIISTPDEFQMYTQVADPDIDYQDQQFFELTDRETTREGTLSAEEMLGIFDFTQYGFAKETFEYVVHNEEMVGKNKNNIRANPAPVMEGAVRWKTDDPTAVVQSTEHIQEFIDAYNDEHEEINLSYDPIVQIVRSGDVVAYITFSGVLEHDTITVRVEKYPPKGFEYPDDRTRWEQSQS